MSLSKDSPPLRPVLCLRNRKRMKELEATEDCFILEFNPDDDVNSSLNSSKHSINNSWDDSDSDDSDVYVVGEKGRSFCYSCGDRLPCLRWTCHAANVGLKWNDQKAVKKEGKDASVISSRGSLQDRPHLGAMFCLKNKEKMKEVEAREDCFILGFNPFDDSDSLDFSKLSINNSSESDSDVCIVAEKGQVACRDYPHPRHDCAKYPFDITCDDNHETHCGMCYCYVCDVPAPCNRWRGRSGHCHQVNNEDGNLLRFQHKQSES